MKSKLKKIFPALLLALVVFGGVVDRASAAIPPLTGFITSSDHLDKYNKAYDASLEFDSLLTETERELTKGNGANIKLINENIKKLTELNSEISDLPQIYTTSEVLRQIETNSTIITELKAVRGRLPDSGVSPENQAILDRDAQNARANLNRRPPQEATPNSILPGQAGNSKPAVNEGKCWNGMWDGLDVGNCLRIGSSWIGAILLWLFSWILRFANQIFNQAINISVREFSNYAGMPAVKVAWSVIRDLVNMGFIFVLLYIAISTILGVGANDWKKLVPKLIIVALLVNFSMFFTRVIIDISNVTANQFYTASASETPKDGEAPDVTTALLKGIPVLRTVFDAPAKKEFSGPENPEGQPVSAGSLSWTNIIVGTFGGVALILVASFVFLAGAVLFIIRSLRLLFLIILSPFAFFFFILPKTEKYTTQWWEALVSDALFAPAFLIMIYVVTKISGEIGKLGNKADNSVIFFMLIIGLLLGALIVAKKLGAMGASKVSSIGKKLGAFGAGALVGGGLGFAGRHSIGRLGNAIGESDRMAKWASKGGAQGWIGRLGMRGGEKVGKASFDVRASKIGKAAGLGGILGGKAGGKGGYTGIQDTAGKQDKETYEKIKDKFGEDSEEAKEYALSIGTRSGIGQRTKTGAALGAGIGAGVVGAFTGGVGAPLGAVVGGALGASAGAIRALYKGRHGRKARKFDRLAEEEAQKGNLAAAEANRQRAARHREDAKQATTATNRESMEDTGHFEEKALTEEIAEIKAKTRSDFDTGVERTRMQTLNEEIKMVDKDIKSTESHARQTGMDMSTEIEASNKIRENKQQQLKLVTEEYDKKLREKIKEATKDKELELEILRKKKSTKNAKRAEEAKERKERERIEAVIKENEKKGGGSEKKPEGEEKT